MQPRVKNVIGDDLHPFPHFWSHISGLQSLLEVLRSIMQPISTWFLQWNVSCPVILHYRFRVLQIIKHWFHLNKLFFFLLSFVWSETVHWSSTFCTATGITKLDAICAMADFIYIFYQLKRFLVFSLLVVWIIFYAASNYKEKRLGIKVLCWGSTCTAWLLAWNCFMLHCYFWCTYNS